MTQDARFKKSPGCPAHGQLLAYQRGALSSGEAEQTVAHLQSCEFCSLLLDLLEFYREDASLPPDPPPMPEGLRHLIHRGREVK